MAHFLIKLKRLDYLIEGIKNSPMQISMIDSIPAFLELKNEWDAVYATDPNSNFFMSWEWLKGWLKITPHPWFILAIRPEHNLPLTSFLPLTIRSPIKSKLPGLIELHLVGKPMGEYSGFLCSKENEDKLLANLAFYIQDRLNWDLFYLTDVLDSRLSHFLQYFDPKEFLVKETNSLCCPFILLQNSWNDYLTECLNSKCRHELRRYLRRFDMANEFNEICTNLTNLESQINIFLTLWQQRWGKKPDSYLKLFRYLILECFDNDCLYLTTLCNAQSPFAALVALVDQKKHTLHVINFSWNSNYASFAPGKIIIAHSIRYAIQNDFEIFDFCRGNNDIKMFFGSKNRLAKSIVIIRKNMRTTFKIMMKKHILFI